MSFNCMYTYTVTNYNTDQTQLLFQYQMNLQFFNTTIILISIFVTNTTIVINSVIILMAFTSIIGIPTKNIRAVTISNLILITLHNSKKMSYVF